MDTKMINLTIDGVNVSVPEGTSVLDAAKSVGIRIPTLCYLSGINEIGACRNCSPARQNLFFPIQIAGFNNHLDNRWFRSLDNCPDISSYIIPSPRLGQADIHDHIDFSGSLVYSKFSFCGFNRR